MIDNNMLDILINRVDCLLVDCVLWN